MEAVRGRVAASGWAPPRWVLHVCAALQTVLLLLGFGVAMVLLGGVPGNGFINALLAVAAAVVVHECGHAIGAFIGGMTVSELRVVFLQVRAGRPRLRWRFKPGTGGVLGMVMALPNPYRSARRQLVPYILGGPLANVVFAVAALVFFVTRIEIDGPLERWAMALFFLNLAFALGNLIPTQGVYGSDGLQLLRALRGRDDTDPEWAGSRATSLMALGATADEIPDALLAPLAAGAARSRMLGLWFAFKRLEARGDWAGAAAMEADVNAAIVALEERLLRAMKDFLLLFRMELRCAKAMAGIEMGARPEGQPLGDLAWPAPGFLQRMEALEALQRGDTESVRRNLARSETLVATCFDRGRARHEAACRAAILNRLPVAMTG
jgi:hypothetical protein